MIETIVGILENGIVVLKDLIINFSPAFGDYLLLGVALIIAYFVESYKKIQPWKIWIPQGVILFLMLKFAGG